MKILALNSGSSTVKFQLIETSLELMERNEDRVLARGAVDRIGTAAATVTYEAPERADRKFTKEVRNHQEAIETALACLTDPEDGIVGNVQQIGGVGHRMVHAGEHYSHSVLIDDGVLQRIEECAALAPLHNPHNLKGYHATRAMLPHSPNVAVFDTAFHQTIPPRAYLYALPYEFYSRHKIRRYGFHGTSHRYVCGRFAQIHGASPEAFKLITCHLGSGSSMCAIDRGRSVDTSMGFTPLEGLVMGTRTGDLDPGVLLHLVAGGRLTVSEAASVLNKRSGLYGISGIAGDMRVLIGESRKGNERARLAIDVFCHRVKKYIGAYVAVLNGADAVIFTGGIGENSPQIRAQVCESMSALGLAVDPEKNERAAGVETDISGEGATTGVWVIPTNEELLIAREALLCILKAPDTAASS